MGDDRSCSEALYSYIVEEEEETTVSFVLGAKVDESLAIPIEAVDTDDSKLDLALEWILLMRVG
jgi:hypothetical protein